MKLGIVVRNLDVLENAVNLALSEGLAHVEIALPALGGFPSNVELPEGLGLSIRAPPTLNLAEDWGVGAALELLGKAREKGALWVTMTPGYYHWSQSRSEAVKRAADSLAELAQSGIAVAVENTVFCGLQQWLTPLGCSPSEYAELAGTPGLYRALNLAHAYVAGWDVEDLEKIAGSRVIAVYLSDTLGEHDLHLPLGAGQVPLLELLAPLYLGNENLTLLLDVLSLEGAKRSIEYLRETGVVPPGNN